MNNTLYQIRINSANYNDAQCNPYSTHSVFCYIVNAMRTFGHITQIETLHTPSPFGVTRSVIITYDDIYQTSEGNTLMYCFTINEKICYGINPRQYIPDTTIPEHDELVICPVITAKG